MTTATQRLVWVGLWCLLLMACGGKKEPSLHVVGHGPSGAVQDAKAALRISFDRPVVSEAEVGKALAKPPLTIRPKLPLNAHWQDRQTLVAAPGEPFRKGTRYQVELSDPLADRLAESFGFDFVHDPLDVIGVTGVDKRWLPVRPTFSLVFDQKVKAKDVVANCQLRSHGGGQSIGLTTSNASTQSESIALATEQPLTQGQSYTLRCAELKPADGNAALLKPYEVALDAYPTLSLTHSSPSAGEKVTPDELTLALTFSTPVDASELSKHVRITPKHPALKRQWLERSGTRYELTATLEAATIYTLSIDGQLKDRFGQQLGQSQEIQFTTTDAAPWLSMESGIYAVEASAAGYPVWSRNVESFDLSCAYVPKAQIPELLLSGVEYSHWYQDNDSKAKLDFKKLGLKARHQPVQTGSRKNKWKKTQLDLGALCGQQTGKRGVYLAEVRQQAVEQRIKKTGGLYPYRVLGNVTDLGVLLKVGPSSGLLWVARLSDAQPVQGATVTLYNTERQKVFSGVSDARGLLMLPGSDKLLPRGASAQVDSDPYAEEEEGAYRDQRVIAVVEKDEDLAIVDGNWSDGIESWNFGLPTDRTGGEVAVRGFIESDRGIYRPGEVVHVKGLAREVPLTGEPRVPRAKQVAIRVEDGSGNELLTKQLTLSEFGGFHFDLPLDPEARTGDYYVTAKLGKSSFRQTFSVEELRPVSFEITAPNLPANLLLGKPIKLDLEARYLFGAPVSGGKVHYEVQRRRHWLSFADYEEYSFEDWADEDFSPWWEPDRYADFLSEGEAETDAQGRYQLTFQDDAKELAHSYDYLVRASVRDETDQEVTKRLSVTAHASQLYLGIASESWVATAGQPFAVRVVALDTAGKPLASKAKLTVERIDHRCGQEEGPYGYWSCERKKSRVHSQELSMEAHAPSALRLEIEGAGEHMIRVEGRDKHGKSVHASTSVWVVGSGDSHWASDSSARMTLIPSKRRFAPGERAKLVPEAATSGGTMLVTVERNGVLEARIERPQGTAAVEVPLSEAHAPNVFVSVALVRGRRGDKDSERPELKLGIANLPVSFAQRALSVEIATQGQDFQPGQTIAGKVRVRAADGSPVRAEVALSAADEGVLQLIGYQTPNPLDSIYASVGLGVQNASSWARVAKLHGIPEDASEEGADGPGSGQDDVRSRFVASAYWAPALVTDERGEASFSFQAPDNLTAFRLMAAVADAGARFGAAEQRVRVRKDLLIAPVVPRFLLADDQIELGAVVHNYTDKPGKLETTFELSGMSPQKKSVTSQVAANAKAVVRLPVKVQPGGAASFAVRSVLRDDSGKQVARDALQLHIPIERAVVKEAETLLSARSANADAKLAWQGGLDEQASGLEVLVDRTGLADLGPSLRYLIHYPYGCLEQTMSGLMPLLRVRELAKSLELSELQGDKLDTYIRLGVAKVVRHQHPDGHFSLWPDSGAYPHLTVYAMWGLNEAKRAGVRVDARALSLGVEAIRGWVSAAERTLAPGDETATMAMAAYVLAELGALDPALNARLFAARKALPVYGKALLARAMNKDKRSAAERDVLVSEVSEAVRVREQVATVHDPIAPSSYYFSSESRSMAMVTTALIELSPSSPLIEPLVLGLKQRRSGGRWGSTQENVYGLLALAEYAKRESRGKVTLEVRAGGKPLLSRTLNGGELARVRVPLASLTQGQPLSVQSNEPVYASAVLYMVRSQPQASALSHGFTVRREYLDMKSEKPIGAVRVGDLLKVRVTIETPKPRRYVAISDPLPSGFESVNTRLVTERETSDDESYRWFFDHRSLRDERTDWFADDLPQGTRVLDYVVRATHPGTFTVPPARVHEMYDESVMGHGKSDLLTVTR